MKTAAFNQKNLISGVIAGVLGGVASGFIMMKKHLLNNIGGMIGMPYPLSGFLFHLFCSAVLGVIFALVFYKLTKDFFSTTVWGVVYGMIWWVIGAMTLAPLMMGTTIAWNMDAIFQTRHMLMCHMVFGLVMGVSYYGLRNSK